MQRWEYARVVPAGPATVYTSADADPTYFDASEHDRRHGKHMHAALAALGGDGWELVAIDKGTHWLKRQVD